MASVGKYNETYFKNHPEEAQKEGVLYGVILVNKKTHEREIIKVGIAAGKDWRHVIKRNTYPENAKAITATRSRKKVTVCIFCSPEGLIEI